VASALSEHTSCPDCHRAIDAPSGFALWCEHCEWNLDSNLGPQAHSVFEKFYMNLSEKWGQSLFQHLIAHNLFEKQPPARTLRIAQAISIGVLMLYGLVWVVSLALLGLGLTYKVAFVAGLLGLGIGFFLWPWRKSALPEGIGPSELPELRKLLRTIAERINAPVPKIICITDEYNASVQEIGYRRTPVLSIGLPLWDMLVEAEKIDLLAHELGHLANQDPLRAKWIHPALMLIFNTGNLICPDEVLPALLAEDFLFFEDASAFHAARLLEVPIKMLLVLVAKGIWTIGHGLLILLWQESQRAEYKADLFGLKFIPLNTLCESMGKMELGSFFYGHAQDWLIKKKPAEQLLPEALKKWERLPAKEKQRYRVLMHKEKHRIDATHPPTLYRIQMLEAQVKYVQQYPLESPNWEALNAEIEPYRLNIAERILDRLRDRLYA
jgi:heat shock protein HtpX